MTSATPTSTTHARGLADERDAPAQPPDPAPDPAPDPSPDPWPDVLLPDGLRGRSDWVPLRIVTLLRWVAIAGQTAAVVAASRLLGLDIATGPASVAIGSAVLVNLFATFLAPRGRRLAEREVAALLAFDIVQLAVLLALTGGLSNPFAMLILGPVTVAATVLPERRSLALGALTVALITAMGPLHLPLGTPAGPLELPRLFLVGVWLALVIGVVFLGRYAQRVTAEVAAMGEALAATRMALSREQRLTDLGGVVAAAAHELGTPLATIKVASSELALELGAPEYRDRPDLREDARLIGREVDRCRDTLRAMGQAGRRDPFLDRVPAEALLREAAGPHTARGKVVEVRVAEGPRSGPQPAMPRRPEIVHGLRNLVQNAVDFAAFRVVLRLDWTEESLTIRINDDGPGFAASDLGRIGDPFLRRRPAGADPFRSRPAGGTDAPRGASDATARPGYGGMGLGLFIAKTLLERTGARLAFANAPEGGAVVAVRWPRAALAEGAGTTLPPGADEG